MSYPASSLRRRAILDLARELRAKLRVAEIADVDRDLARRFGLLLDVDRDLGAVGHIAGRLPVDVGGLRLDVLELLLFQNVRRGGGGGAGVAVDRRPLRLEIALHALLVGGLTADSKNGGGGENEGGADESHG